MSAPAVAPARDVVVLRLAEGGMGYVELVARREDRFRRLFARKRLHPHHRADPVFRSMFLDEARLGGLIRHPNVAAVLEIGDDQDGPFMLMDYVEGPSVADIIEHVMPRDNPLPIALAIGVAAQTARGLDAAHRLLGADGTPLGLVHRDISPKNLLVGYDGLVRVADFGIAKAKDNLAETRVGVLKGNIGYMAPEYLRFQEIDGRSDLFSLGVVLYEMLARERLYAGDDSAAVARRILEEPPPDIFEVRDVPPEVVALLFDLLAKDPALRPASALEVATRLDAINGGLVAIEGPFDMPAFLELELADLRRARQAAVDQAMAALPTVARSSERGIPAVRGEGAAPVDAAGAATAPAAPGPALKERRGGRARRLAVVAAVTVAIAAGAATFMWKRSARRAPGAFTTAAPALWTGGWHSCALHQQRLYCWGSNIRGQLGEGTTQSHSTPVAVHIGPVRAVAMGEHHTCAIGGDGRVLCWGRNVRGEVGPSAPTVVKEPVALDRVGAGAGSVTDLAAGRQHTCARLASGAVICWGANESGQLGRPPSDGGEPPAPVPGLPPVERVFAGGSNSCASTAAGVLHCWGANENGQLGGGAGAPRPTPAPVPEVADVVSVAIGNNARAGSKNPDLATRMGFMCAATRAGIARCWGNNSTGQLGDGTREDRAGAVTVVGVTDVIAVDAGNQHACALRRSGQVLCWGRNEFGAVGDDTMGPATVRMRPVAAAGVTGAVGLALGDAHSCARRANGEVMCWGVNNFGQLGEGSTTLRAAPHLVAEFP